MPALAAGLEFETHPVTHQKLDDTLQNEASMNPQGLPLLEFCLDELYKLRNDSLVITWESYEKFGGLNGAIAKRAEDTFRELSPAAQEAFPQLLSALVTMDAVATSRPVPRRALVRDPRLEEAVDAFTRAHLFVVDADQSGEPVIAVAHEALIAFWPRVQEWVQENQDFLRLKSRIAQAAQRWRQSGKDDDFLLPKGKPLAEAEDALAKRPEALDEIEFVQASIRFAVRRRHQRQMSAAGALALVLALVFGAVLARHGQLKKAASEIDFATAVDELNQDKISDSLAYLADAMDKDPGNAKAIALAIAELRDVPLPVLVLQHQDELRDVQFSPDGSRVATACADGTALVWDLHAGKAINDQARQHGRLVRSAEYNQAGTEIVTASYDGTARLWDALTGKALPLPALGTADDGTICYSAKFSQDSTRIVTAKSDGSARIWNAVTGAPVGALMQHDPDKRKAVWTADFNPAGTLVVTACADHKARVWDAWTGLPVIRSGREVVLEHGDEVNCASFSPDGRWILTASDDGTAKIWDAQTFLLAGNKTIKHQAQVNFASFSTDSKFVVTAGSDKTARIWTVPDGDMVGVPMWHDGWVRSASFSRDGKLVVTASYDGTARVWDARTGSPMGEPMRHGGAVYTARFNRAGSMIATASFDHTVRIWTWPLGSSHPVMRQPGVMKSAMFAPEGRRLATIADGAAQIWDARTGQPAGQAWIPESAQTGLTGAEFSSDGEWLLTSTGHSVRLWNTRTGQGNAPLAEAGLVTAAFSPDHRKVLMVAGHDVLLRDAQSGRALLDQPIRPGGALSGAAFSPDGRMVAAWTCEGAVSLWDAQSGKAIPTGPMQHDGVVNRAHFSPDSRWLVTASADHTAKIWNTRTGALAAPPMKHDSWVLDATFSGDGRWILTASADQTAQIWDAQTGQAVHQALRHKQAVTAARFSPDERWVVTVSMDGIAQVWDARTGFPMGKPIAGGSKVVSADFSPDSHSILIAWEDGTARIWDTPITAKAAPGWLIDLARNLGGWKLDEHGALQPAVQDLPKLLGRLAHLKGNDAVSQFGRWLAAGPGTRPPAP